MTDPMVSFNVPPRAERVEVITSVQSRRHWTTQEKVRLVEETYLPGQSVSLVARCHGLNANRLFTWRQLMARGAFTAAGPGGDVVTASELRAAQQQIRELQRPWARRRWRPRSSARRWSGSPPPTSCPRA